jgi:ribosomal protein S18 acetylase RimI-like enzyme
MTATNWHLLAPSVVEPLLHEEIAAWRGELHWDIRKSWQVIEPARRAGRLPGIVVTDGADRSEGWTCFFADRRTLQVMALVAASSESTVELVDALLAAAGTEATDTITFFVRAAAPGLEACLRERDFEVARYRYLVKEKTSGVFFSCTRKKDSRGLFTPEPLGSGTISDQAAALLERAYATSPELRAFAPDGTPTEWREYVANLLGTTDCGTFLPEASFLLPGAQPGCLGGVVITTQLDDETAHIAQLAVDPFERRRGLGRQLLEAALTAASDRGLVRTTLLVSAANVRALSLYEAEGFSDRAVFLAARRCQPRRFTSVALATGGASTRR